MVRRQRTRGSADVMQERQNSIPSRKLPALVVGYPMSAVQMYPGLASAAAVLFPSADDATLYQFRAPAAVCCVQLAPLSEEAYT